MKINFLLLSLLTTIFILPACKSKTTTVENTAKSKLDLLCQQWVGDTSFFVPTPKRPPHQIIHDWIFIFNKNGSWEKTQQHVNRKGDFTLDTLQNIITARIPEVDNGKNALMHIIKLTEDSLWLQSNMGKAKFEMRFSKRKN